MISLPVATFPQYECKCGIIVRGFILLYPTRGNFEFLFVTPNAVQYECCIEVSTFFPCCCKSEINLFVSCVKELFYSLDTEVKKSYCLLPII